MDGMAFAQRLALAQFPDGSMLFDLATGILHRPNASGARIFSALAAGQTPEKIAREIAEETRAQYTRVLDDVQALLAQLNVAPPAQPPQPFSYRAGAEGFVLTDDRQDLLHISPDGLQLRRLHDLDAPGVDPATYLCWAAVQILALQGQPLLHAATVERADGILVLLGRSGVGKTTTARALQAEGAMLVSEDLLAVASEGSRLVGFCEGSEAAILDWALRSAEVLSNPGCNELGAAKLAKAVRQGAARPLQEAWFLNATRCAGEVLQIEPLPPAVALVQLLEAGVGALPRRDLQLRCFEVACTLVTSCRVRAVSAPQGHDTLRTAVRSHAKQTQTLGQPVHSGVKDHGARR